MSIDLRDSRRQQVDAGNAIDWEHPDNRGLVYLMPGYAGTQAAGGFVNNLVSSNPFATPLLNGAKWGGSPPFPGVAGINLFSATSGGEILAPNSIRIAPPITLAISIKSNGTAPTNYTQIFGVTYDNVVNPPYLAYSICLDTVNLNGWFVETPGLTTKQATSTTSLTSLTRPSRVVLVIQAARMDLYLNGLVIASTTYSAITGTRYTSTSMFTIGSTSLLARNLNATVWGGRIQNFAADAGWVARDYQRHLNPTTDDRLRWFSSRSYSVPSSGSDGVGTASGTSTVSGVGASTAASVGSSSGVGAASGVGRSTAASVGSSAGVGAAAGVGASTAASVGSSTGTGSASAVGASTAASVGTSTGTSTVSGVGTSVSSGSGVGSAAGTSTVAGVGRSTAASVGSAAGTATASAVGTSSGSGSVATATGTSTASAVSASAVAAIFSAVGTCTVNGISPSASFSQADPASFFTMSDGISSIGGGDRPSTISVSSGFSFFGM